MLKILLLIFLFAPLTFWGQEADTTQALPQDKKYRRFIHPKTCYFVASAGSAFLSTLIDDRTNLFKNGNTQNGSSGLFSIAYEHGIKNNYFLEFGYLNYETGINLISASYESGNYWGHYQGLTRFHQFNLGTGYRIIDHRNRHWASIHAGLLVGFQSSIREDQFDSPNYSVVDDFSGETTGFLFSNTATSQFSLGSFIGVSKDIRLSEDVRLFVKYMQQVGFRSIFSGEIFSSSNGSPIVSDTAYRTRNSGGMLLAGLRIQMFKKRTNELVN
jgi:hypothetical protein